jgi:hypothetical protein
MGPPIYDFCVLGVTQFYWLKWGLRDVLPQMASNYDPPDLHFPSSWD